MSGGFLIARVVQRKPFHRKQLVVTTNLVVSRNLPPAPNYCDTLSMYRYFFTRHVEPKYREAWRRLKLAQGVVIPGGFGNRGIEGKE